jgi:hypothetical protein
MIVQIWGEGVDGVSESEQAGTDMLVVKVVSKGTEPFRSPLSTSSLDPLGLQGPMKQGM